MTDAPGAAGPGVPAALSAASAGSAEPWRAPVAAGALEAVVELPGSKSLSARALLLAAIAPGNFWTLYVGISLVLWIEYFRVVRARTQALVTSPQIEASRLLGFGPVMLFRRHLWPELAPQVFTLAAFGAALRGRAVAGFV